MSHAPSRADKLLIKPAAGARPAPPRTRGQIIPKARTAASHPTSHTRHGDNQARNCSRQTNLASLTVTRCATCPRRQAARGGSVRDCIGRTQSRVPPFRDFSLISLRLERGPSMSLPS